MSKRLWDKGQKNGSGDQRGALNQRVLEFTVGSDYLDDLNLLSWDAIASAAQARMLEAVNILSPEECTALLGELHAIYQESLDGRFSIPLELEDCHTAIEVRLVERCQDAGKRIHTGRSRNDQVLTAMRLYLRSAVLDMLEKTASLTQALLQRALQDWQVQMPGYTHMQAAMPSSIGLWLHSFAESFQEEISEGLNLLQLINTNPLGAAAGFGVPLPLDRELTANLLKFSRVQWNPIQTQNSRGRYELKVICWMRDIAALVEKLAWDLQLYNTAEFGFVTFPLELTTGSSIMPQKRNPDCVELLRAKASRIRGRAAELEWIVGKLPSNYHRDFQYTKAPVFFVNQELQAMLPVCQLIIEEMVINTSKLELAMGAEVFATYDAFIRVREGVPFRDAYRATAQNLEQGNLDIPRLRQEFDVVMKNLPNWIKNTSAALEISNARILSWHNELQEIPQTIFR